MARFVKHGPCEFCGSRDNRAFYDDGSSWCFGCGKKPDKATRVVFSQQEDNEEVALSDDLCYDFPKHVVDWLQKYHLTIEEAIRYEWKYSPKYDQLTFIYRDKDKNVALTQCRNFRAGKRKYFNTGSVAAVLPVFWAPDSSRTIVVPEDALSAARIARYRPSMPCLGSHLPVKKIMALKRLGFETMVVWLDSNKLNEAREIAQMGKWIGLSTKVVYTELDPKEYSDMEIRETLDKI